MQPLLLSSHYEVEQDNTPSQQFSYGEVYPLGKQALRNSVLCPFNYEEIVNCNYLLTCTLYLLKYS